MKKQFLTIIHIKKYSFYFFKVLLVSTLAPGFIKKRSNTQNGSKRALFSKQTSSSGFAARKLGTEIVVAGKKLQLLRATTKFVRFPLGAGHFLRPFPRCWNIFGPIAAIFCTVKLANFLIIKYPFNWPLSNCCSYKKWALSKLSRGDWFSRAISLDCNFWYRDFWCNFTCCQLNAMMIFLHPSPLENWCHNLATLLFLLLKLHTVSEKWGHYFAFGAF